MPFAQLKTGLRRNEDAMETFAGIIKMTQINLNITKHKFYERNSK